MIPYKIAAKSHPFPPSNSHQPTTHIPVSFVNLVDFLKPKLHPIRPHDHRTTQRHEEDQQDKAASAPGAGTAAAEAEAFLEPIEQHVEQE